jgi:hypothetical protein
MYRRILQNRSNTYLQNERKAIHGLSTAKRSTSGLLAVKGRVGHKPPQNLAQQLMKDAFVSYRCVAAARGATNPRYATNLLINGLPLLVDRV